MNKQSDIIIIGGGIAGLTAAYLLSKKSSVTIIDSGDGVLKMSSTQLAQAGIAASVNWEKYFEDTMKVGEFKSNKKSVEVLCKESMSAVKFLKEEIGVSFLDEQSLEGGHSERRIFTTGDNTGGHIYSRLFNKCRKQEAITWVHKARVLRILKNEEGDLDGVVYECLQSRKVERSKSHYVIIATGGIGGLFECSTNPSNLKGDGLLLAHEAGAELEDLLNIQFHPTGLKYESHPVFLLSEAMRGEGASLLNEKQERFLGNLPQKELSPRNIVVAEMMKQEEVFMDLRHKSKKFWENHFPNICKNLEGLGYDISDDLLPVTPVQHFLCGGIKTDLNAETNVKNLFAIGESASTGIHGSNRLAANSLTEAVVFSLRCSEYIIRSLKCKVQSAKLESRKSFQAAAWTTSLVTLRDRFCHCGEGATAPDEAIQIYPFATEQELNIIRNIVQKYMSPGKKNILALRKALENISDSFEKRILLLFSS
ncbi:FAD-dependent oxidoreductase [Candidatus Peregrinibacteria bacterium]|jgi:L-aspartate oxidase|nr:FAD-dependent oxidoreductase [Candidatus Peregrinibacteria bacterium]